MEQDATSDLVRQRLEKFDRMKNLDVEMFPYSYPVTHRISNLLESFDSLSGDDSISIAGRIMSNRLHGKTGFSDMQDEGSRIQIYVRKDVVGEKAYSAYRLVDIGDILGVTGHPFVTRSGERTLFVDELTLLTKALHPLPVVKEKVEGEEVTFFDVFQDKETRYRKRYLDLLVNPGVREVFVKRSKILSEIRRFFDREGFVEVETPILQPIYGGAFARPFTTHHFRLDMPLYLRIADELYLKRLIIGGFNKVYEMSKNFRNEGIDRTHNPEYTSLEAYWAYVDYHSVMELTENLFSHLVHVLGGDWTVPYGDHEVNLEPPWRRVRMCDAIREETGLDVEGAGKDELVEFLSSRPDDLPRGFEVGEMASCGELMGTIFENFVEKKLIQPTFVLDYPLEISPLAKVKRGDEKLVERFELFIAGDEVANAFSELNDPFDQRRRFEDQCQARAGDDGEEHRMDEDFLEAMTYGMPPTGGIGFGIDRIVMLFTNSHSIRDVILFPHMRPEKGK